MSTSLIVNEKNELLRIREPYFPAQPTAIRVFAKIISYVFHPAFIPLYVIYFLAYIHPYLYVGFHPQLKAMSVMGAAIVAYALFPIVTVLLLKGLNFIDNIYLYSQKDRVIPFIACMVWYFFIWYVWKNFGKTPNAIDMPPMAVKFAFATFISTIIGLMANIIMKISLHAIAVGLMLTFFIILSFTQQLNFAIFLSIAILITGLVCTARFVVSDHTPKEVYSGLLAGAASMLLAYWVG